MEHRSPLESIFNAISGLPQGHDKPIKHALYNALALFLLVLCCAAGYSVYMILEPFIKPLMWAVLVGSALHPLKRSLRYRFQSWFESLDSTDRPVVLGIGLVPFNIINDLSEFIGENLWKRLWSIVASCIALPVVHLIYYYTPKIIVTVTWRVVLYGFKVLGFFLDNSSVWIVVLILLGYVSLVFLTWKPENNTKFHYASTAIWLLCSCCLSNQFGSMQVPIFILLQVIFFGGFISEVYDIHTAMNNTGHPISIMECLSLAFHDKPLEIDLVDEKDAEAEEAVSDEAKDEIPLTSTVTGTISDSPNRPKDPWSLELFTETHPSPDRNIEDMIITNRAFQLLQSTKKPPKSTSRTPPLHRSLSQPQFSNASLQIRKNAILNSNRLSFNYTASSLIDVETYESTFYLYTVLWMCIVMLFWKNVMLIPLLPLPILFYVTKHLGIYLGLWSYLGDRFDTVFEMVVVWCRARHDALVPVPIRGLYRVVYKVNMVLKGGVKGSMDTVASCVVIIGLMVFLLCGSVFIALQIYAETIMLIQMTGNVINQTVVHNPELRQLLPPAWDDTVDSILDNAYQYGREGISKAVKGMTSDVDTTKSEKLEKQILELWDRIYQNWMSSNDSNGPKVTEDAVKSSWEEFITDLQKSSEMLNINGLIDFGKQNIGTLMSLLESIWGILKGNISLILGSFSTFLSVILGGGTAVLNFILNVVVFLTTLFYLLNSSGELYKPVEILTNFSQSGRRIGHALEGAVNGVFMASFKMAVFYGLWTWFIHNLFGVKIVYLPSAFATILGAVPFLGTYWACIPAVLDLWLAQDRGIAAIIFFICQFLPTSVVDTTIYKEIKGGGHPYLTGLAIAGGIFCLGVEGAIIGPMLLCGLYVAIDLSSSLFKESPSVESINLRLHQLKDDDR